MTTFVKQYESLPHEVRNLIDEYDSNLGWAEDCFSTLLSIYPPKECSIRALAEAYAEWYHYYKVVEEKLKALGYDDTAILQLSLGKHEKYSKK